MEIFTSTVTTVMMQKEDLKFVRYYWTHIVNSTTLVWLSTRIKKQTYPGTIISESQDFAVLLNSSLIELGFKTNKISVLRVIFFLSLIINFN